MKKIISLGEKMLKILLERNTKLKTKNILPEIHLLKRKEQG